MKFREYVPCEIVKTIFKAVFISCNVEFEQSERGDFALELKKCEPASEDAQTQHSTFK